MDAIEGRVIRIPGSNSTLEQAVIAQLAVRQDGFAVLTSMLPTRKLSDDRLGGIGSAKG